MGDSWDVPDGETSVGDREFIVTDEGICIKRTCGGKDKEIVLIPKDTFIEAWNKYISTDVLVQAWRKNIPCSNKS